jgi:hypothetical protein
VAAGFLSVLELPAPVAEAKRSALLRLSEQLEPGDAVVAARAIGDLSLREAVLARFEAQYSQASPFAFGRSGIGPTRIGVLLLLAQTRLEMENSAAYLKTIDLLGSIEGRVDPALLRRLRVIALICLNRLDEVFDIDPTPDDWLDGLAHALRLPQATMVANEIQGRFGATLTDGQRKRLELLTQRAKAGTAVLQGTGPSTQR